MPYICRRCENLTDFQQRCVGIHFVREYWNKINYIDENQEWEDDEDLDLIESETTDHGDDTDFEDVCCRNCGNTAENVEDTTYAQLSQDWGQETRMIQSRTEDKKNTKITDLKTQLTKEQR